MADQMPANPRTGRNAKRIVKIALTGGPCGGKTTILPAARDLLELRGLTVFVVNETVTELYANNVRRSERLDNPTFVKLTMREQIGKERLYRWAAEQLTGRAPVVILCDRGVPDGRAYFDDDARWECWAQELGTSFAQVRDSYDGVVHLVTAAKGAPEAYQRDNEARFETPEQAVATDSRILAQWQGHPHLVVIGNDGGFAEKRRRALEAIGSLVDRALREG